MQRDPYLLPSNMDQCLALTSSVTALPAVSLMETADGGGLAVSPIQMSCSGP